MVGERLSTPDLSRTIPFRAILILSDPEDLTRLIERASNLRERDGFKIGVMIRDADHRPEEVSRLVRLIDPEKVPPGIVPIVNSPPVDLEIPSGWWVHLSAARAKEGSDLRRPFGCSVHSTPELDVALSTSASYVIIGPVWPTDSKPDHPGIGIENFSSLGDETYLPVFGVGGVTSPDRVSELMEGGAYGFACRSCGTDVKPGRLNEMLTRLDFREYGREVRSR